MEEMILKFVEIGSGSGDGYGSGYGDGSGDGYGSGSGSGDGYGSGYGDGSGDGYGSDYGDGYGYGYGSGSGDGYGYGYGSGYGYGYGSGDGYGLFGAVLDTRKIYNIDRIPTVIYQVLKNCAKGAVINDDMTLTPCYIVKRGTIFAHGKTLHKAQEALNKKMIYNMPIEERILAFREKFAPDIAYPNQSFYEWHNTLTGSCEMGRNQFAKEHDVDLNGKMTVKEFISLTENAYGGEIIKMLKPYYYGKESGKQ